MMRTPPRASPRGRQRGLPAARWLAPLRQQWHAALAQVAPHWQALAAREKLAVQLALVALGVLVAWLIAVAPALATLRSAPAAQAALDIELERMRRLAAEAQALRRQPALPAGQAEAALRAATDRLGPAARLTLSGDRVTVSFTGVEPGALLAWLNDVRGAARARPVDAQLTRSGNGYSGAIVLALNPA